MLPFISMRFSRYNRCNTVSVITNPSFIRSLTLEVVPFGSVDNVLSARSVRKLRLRSNCSGVSGNADRVGLTLPPPRRLTDQYCRFLHDCQPAPYSISLTRGRVIVNNSANIEKDDTTGHMDALADSTTPAIVFLLGHQIHAIKSGRVGAAPKSVWVAGDPVPMVRGPTLNKKHWYPGRRCVRAGWSLLGWVVHVTSTSLPTMLTLVMRKAELGLVGSAARQEVLQIGEAGPIRVITGQRIVAGLASRVIEGTRASTNRDPVSVAVEVGDLCGPVSPRPARCRGRRVQSPFPIAHR